MSRSKSALFLILLTIAGQKAAGQGFDDEFNGFALNPGWTWLNPTPPYWQLTGTAMRIITQRGALNGPNHNDVKNVLLQTAPSGDFRMDTKLVFSPDSVYHNAGLIYMLDEDNYVRVSRGMWNNINGVWLEWELNALTDFAFLDGVIDDTLYFRMSRSGGTTFRGYYSPDGVAWVRIGEVTVPFTGTEARIGLQAANGQGVLATNLLIPADFDYFRMILGDVGRFAAEVGAAPLIIGVFPSPASAGRAAKVTYMMQKTGSRVLSLTDVLGRILWRHEASEEAGNHDLVIPLAGVPPGNYLVNLESAGRKSGRMIIVD